MHVPDNKLPFFFLGLGVGVAAGLLLAPQSGEETRQLIKSRADEGKDYLKRRTDDLKDSATEALQRGKTVVSKQKEQVSAAVEAGKQAYREAMRSAGAGAEEV
jgi:gas vesicle protein